MYIFDEFMDLYPYSGMLPDFYLSIPHEQLPVSNDVNTYLVISPSANQLSSKPICPSNPTRSSVGISIPLPPTSPTFFELSAPSFTIANVPPDHAFSLPPPKWRPYNPKTTPSSTSSASRNTYLSLPPHSPPPSPPSAPKSSPPSSSPTTRPSAA